MSDTDIISIVLPTYNGARTIGRSIESVQAQSHASWELLVIDDGSTDATASVVEGYAAKDARVRYVPNESNLGIQKSLNRGLALAQGTYVARIDDDDSWSDADKLAGQHRYMLAHPKCVLVGTGTIVVDEKGTELFRYLLPETDAQIRSKILFRNCFTHSSVLFSLEETLKAGGYGETPETRHIEDYDLWLRLGMAGELANLPSYSVSFTMHAKSLSALNKLAQFENDRAVIRKYKDAYPGYAAAAAYGSARSALYRLFGGLVSPKLRSKLLAFSKK